MFAVRVFFMSGFYMALVLETRYKDSILAFYKARALRLYPVYWVTLILTVVFLVVMLGQLHTFAYWAELFKNPRSWWLIPPVVLSNVSFFGIDSMYLFTVNTSQGSLIYYKCASDLQTWPCVSSSSWVLRAMATQASFT
jgi:peptidoglycan/LPS O-acetylase OafA/YrhL